VRQGFGAGIRLPVADRELSKSIELGMPKLDGRTALREERPLRLGWKALVAPCLPREICRHKPAERSLRRGLSFDGWYTRYQASEVNPWATLRD